MSGPADSYELLALPDRAGGISLGQHVGWVERKSLLLRRQAEVDEKSKVARKVWIVNTVLSLQRRHQGQLIELSTRLGPAEDAPEGRKVRLLDLYFRYAEREDRHRQGWILIGPDPDLFSAPRPTPGLVGWVPREMIVPFDGRHAVEWNREAARTIPARVFRNRPMAYQARDEKVNVSCLYIEQSKERGETGFGPAMPRFPLVPYAGDADYPRIDPATNNELLKVIGLGAFLDAAEARREAAEVRREIRGLEARLADPSQILFVIDDTLSMKDHLPTVADTIAHHERCREGRSPTSGNGRGLL